MAEESTKRRRQFTPEFKREAVRLLLDGGQTPGEVGRRLGVRPDMLRAWRRQFAQSAVPPDGAAGERRARGHAAQVTSQDEEIRRLKRQVEVLQQERDFLKRAAAFFARESR
jgi:transposase